MRLIFLIAAAAMLAGCHVSPHPPDPEASGQAVTSELIHAPLVRIEVLTVNGVAPPKDVIDRVVEKFKTRINGDIELISRGNLEAPTTPNGVLERRPQWPVREGDRQLTEADFGETPGVRALSVRDGMIEGAAAYLTQHGLSIQPCAPTPCILIMCIGREPGTLFVTGYLRRLASFDEAGNLTRSGGSLIVIQDSVIEARSNLFVSKAKLWEWTLTHELGHAFRVPADAARTWQGPHFGAHCTHPECVMYPDGDWRAVMSGLLNGWPLDYCDECAKEIEAAKNAPR